MSKRKWLIHALVTTIFWGVWGALIDLPEKEGFPQTLNYVVWAVTMVIPAIIALKIINWKLDVSKRAIIYGSIIGILGAGGQLILFTGAIERGPAYLIFPIISLSPSLTILLSILFLKERASYKGWIGISLAILAIPFLSFHNSVHGSNGYLWLIYALLVFVAWGLQAYFMRFANRIMNAESIFFYMMLAGLVLSPIALVMTNFSQHINWEKGPYSAFAIQMLNSVGALTLVYAFRYGKAIIISPLTNAVAPVITVILSLILYQVFPNYIVLAGIILAIMSISILAFEE